MTLFHFVRLLVWSFNCLATQKKNQDKVFLTILLLQLKGLTSTIAKLFSLFSFYYN